MSNFTKGPWVVKYNGGETQLIADGECIMSDMTYYPWVPENTADWHLIAAAPEMYEALKNIENDDNHMPESAWSLIQDALAKAEGK